MEKLTFTAQKNEKLAVLLSEKGFSYATVSKLLRQKDVRVDDIKSKDNILVEKGSEITVFYDAKMREEKSADIIFEDTNILIVNKPKGIEIEGEDGLANKLGAIATHRLDRNTTGLVVFAKNTISAESLLAAFKNKTITKKYVAEVVGKTEYKNFSFKAFLSKDSKLSKVKIFNQAAKGASPIETIFTTIKSSSTSSIVECQLVTGKTHQIRASLAFLGHAIIGDGKYGKNEDNKKFKEKSQKLHCFFLRFEKLKSPLSYLNGKEFVCKSSFYNVDNFD